jgi:hypothetical protein
VEKLCTVLPKTSYSASFVPQLTIAIAEENIRPTRFFNDQRPTGIAQFCPHANASTLDGRRFLY